jgi:predicted DNA-binding transcriptional regulator AlpA
MASAANMAGAELPAPGLLSDYVSKEQLAQELRRTTRTLDRWLLHGNGPAYVRLGRRVLFRKGSIEEWLLGQEQGAPAQGAHRRRGNKR